MKSRNSVIAVIVLVIAIAFGAYFVTKSNLANKERAQLSAAFSEMIGIVEDFHAQIKTNLSPSVAGKPALQKELSRMKDFSEQSCKKLGKLEAKIFAVNSKEANATKETIEKSEKYIASYAEWATLRVNKEDLRAAADSMLRSIDLVKDKLNVYGSPDEGDVSKAINNADKLVSNFQKAGNASSSIKGRPGTVPVNDYWANVAYSSYYRSMKSILADYDKGRKVLNTVIDHYDRGVLTSFDQKNWCSELERRKDLRHRLSDIRLDIPPGSIYETHHRYVDEMLLGAIVAMEEFADSENSYTRRKLHDLSVENTAIMKKIKPFYGLR